MRYPAIFLAALIIIGLLPKVHAADFGLFGNPPTPTPTPNSTSNPTSTPPPTPTPTSTKITVSPQPSTRSPTALQPLRKSPEISGNKVIGVITNSLPAYGVQPKLDDLKSLFQNNKIIVATALLIVSLFIVALLVLKKIKKKIKKPPSDDDKGDNFGKPNVIVS